MLMKSHEGVKAFSFYRNNFDLIRLLAAVQVVLFQGMEHFGIRTFFSKLLWTFPGIPIFFVISGFLISASWDNNASWLSYMRNRILRIYPSLWFCFFLTLLVVLFVIRPDCDWRDLLLWSTAQMSFGQFYNPDFLRSFGVGVINGSLWTIAIELQFYCLLPFFLKLSRRFFGGPWRSVLLLIFLAAMSQVYVHFFYGRPEIYLKLLGVSVLPYLYLFYLGMLLQKNLLLVEKFLQGRAFYFLLLYLLVMLLSYQMGWSLGGNFINPLAAVSLGLLVISAAYSYPVSDYLLRGQDWSYGLYIYHFLIMNLLMEFSPLSKAENMFLLVMLSLLAAALSWRFIERPAIRMKWKTTRRSLSLAPILIVGKEPPPIGGLSIHVKRSLYWLRQSAVDFRFYDLKEFSPLRLVMQMLKADAVHLHTSSPLLRVLTGFFCFMTYRRLIITYHGNLGRWSFWGNALDYLSVRLCTQAHVLNRTSYQIGRRLNGNCRLVSAFVKPCDGEEVLGNDIEASIDRFCEGRRFFCTNAWSLNFDRLGNEIYGIVGLVDVFRGLPEERLVISDPSGTYRQYLKEQGVSVPENILLICCSHSFIGVMKKSFCMLRCTTTDGDSISVREALYYGVRVIASDAVPRPKAVQLYEIFNWEDLRQQVITVGETPLPPRAENDGSLDGLLTLYGELERPQVEGLKHRRD